MMIKWKLLLSLPNKVFVVFSFFFFLVGQPILGGEGGGQRGRGLTLNPMEKFIHYIVNDYSFKTNEDIDMGSSDAYIEC